MDHPNGDEHHPTHPSHALQFFSIFHRRGTAISGTKRDSENECGHFSPDIASTVPRLCHDYKNMSAGLFGTLPPPWYAVLKPCCAICYVAAASPQLKVR